MGAAVSEGKARTELLIVHVATLGRGHLLGRRRHRRFGSATVEHDSRDLAQSGRIDQRVVRKILADTQCKAKRFE